MTTETSLATVDEWSYFFDSEILKLNRDPEESESTPDPGPAVWPQCSECGLAYIFRRARSTTGRVWVWQADCKHFKKDPILMTAEGPYQP